MRSVIDYVSHPSDPVQTTKQFQDAIDDAARGDGLLVVPAGRYLVTMLTMRSGLTLRLERGARLLTYDDLSAYPELEMGHNKDRQPFHTIYADGCDGLTIEGDGIIDGQGEKFWNPPLGDPEQGAVGLFYREKKQRVSPLMEISNSKNVRLRGFTIENSPGWTVHLNMCDDVRIHAVTLKNHLFGPNTDGFDINGCRDVMVSDCDLTCGDDAIILKATKDARSCERIAVTNCILASNCAALGLGAETAHPIRDIAFSNCISRQALRIIQIEMWEPSLIENVAISNITGKSLPDVPLDRAIYMDIQQHRRDEPTLGQLRNVSISNFTATTRGRVMMTAQDGATIENITLRDIHLKYEGVEDPEWAVPKFKSSQMSNYSPKGRVARAALVADNVRRLRVANMSTDWSKCGENDPPMHGAWLRNVSELALDSPWLTASQEGVERIYECAE